MTKVFDPATVLLIPDDYNWENEDAWDPMAWLYGHPVLPAGWNSAAYNGDEMNGAGINEPVWPALFQATQVFPPTVVDQQDMEEFAQPSLTIRGEQREIVMRPEVRHVIIRR